MGLPFNTDDHMVMIMQKAAIKGKWFESSMLALGDVTTPYIPSRIGCSDIGHEGDQF